MEKIQKIRSKSHQLTKTKLSTAKDVVSWMGAIQAQSYNMSKWAIGIRSKGISLNSIQDSLDKGEILRPISCAQHGT